MRKGRKPPPVMLRALLASVLFVIGSARAAAPDPVTEARVALAQGDGALAAAWLALVPADPDRALLLADALSRDSATCDAALEALSTHDCSAPDCPPRIASIERRCLVDSAALTAPDGERLTPDGPAYPGRIAVGRRWIHTATPDGRRLRRALCVEPGQPLTLPADAAVPLDGDAATRARAHLRAVAAHGRARQRCEQLMHAEAAQALAPTVDRQFNVALAHSLRPGGCADGVRAFDALAAEHPGAPSVDRGRAHFARSRAACTGTLSVVSAPADADVRVDGVPIDPSGALLAGVHRVEITAPAHQAGAWAVRVTPGEVTTLSASLDPTPPPAEPAAPPAEPGSTPTDPVAIDYPSPVVTPPGSTFRLGWLWVPMTAAGLGLATGATFTALATGDRRDFDRALAAADRPAAADARAALALDRDLAYTGWVVAGAGAAALVAGLLFDDAVGFVARDGEVGLTVGGRF